MSRDGNTSEQNLALVSLSECGELYCGQSSSVAEVNTDGRGLPYFTGPEQWDGSRLHINKWTEHPKRIVPEGCIFITVKGAGVGKMFPGMAGAVGRDIYAYRVNEAVEFKYVYYAIKFTIEQIVAQAKGDIPGLSKNHILDHKILLPSIQQQRRVVAKIEELFSELDKCFESLKIAREQLKAYRQSFIKHAFEGKLTRGWRSVNSQTVEKLLADIQVEREIRKPKKAIRLKTGQHDPSLAPVVPEGWTTDHLGNLNVEVFDGPFGSHLKTADYVEAGIRVIRLENIGRGKFIDGKRSFVSEKKYQDIRKHTVVPGDIVFSSFVTEAIRSTLVPSHIPFAVNKADCFGIRFFGKTTNAKFVQLFLQSRNAFRQIEGMIHGVGRPRINTSQLKEVVVPICSPVEQARIVEMIDVLFSRIEAFDSAIENGFTQISTLRQSVLKRAFSGGLVPKDAADEPASVMLERIRAEQKEGESKKRRNSKNGKEAA
ncbi:type I restriction enzyme S subunit [Bradyrhizobium japonicum]